MRENIRQEIDLFNLHLRVIENFTELMKTRDRFKKTKKENVRYKVESYYTIELFVGFVEIFKSHCSEMSGFFFFFFFANVITADWADLNSFERIFSKILL